MPSFLSILALLFVVSVALQAHADALIPRDHLRHDRVARRKRSDTALCKPRPSTTAPSTSSTDATPAYTSSPPPASTTSSAPPASTTPASTAPASTRKWGLAWGADIAYLPNFTKYQNVGWFYNWRPDIPKEVGDAGLVGMPILWGPGYVESFQADVIRRSGVKVILGMNEPNEPSQASIDAGTGASLWQQYIDPFKDDGTMLISPACTNDDAGLDWYKNFFAACSGCHFDAIAFHAYTTDAQAAIDYATKLHNTYNLPICITEFADQNFSGGAQASMDQVWDFAGKMRDFVNNTPWIMCAFPFGLIKDIGGGNIQVNPANELMNDDGTPTALANFYFS